jgi:hypothetical protein
MNQIYKFIWNSFVLLIWFVAPSNSPCRRPVMKTYASSETNRSAVASPKALLPPVTTATLSSSLLLLYYVSGYWLLFTIIPAGFENFFAEVGILVENEGNFSSLPIDTDYITSQE